MQKIRKQHQKIPVSFCLFQVLSLVKSSAIRCSEHEKKSPNCIFLSTLHDTPRLHESWIMTQTLPEGILDFILIWLIFSWNYKSQQEIPNFRSIPKRPRVDVFGLSLLKWSCSPTNFSINWCWSNDHWKKAHLWDGLLMLRLHGVFLRRKKSFCKNFFRIFLKFSFQKYFSLFY